jgi:hypothetical protein
VLRRLDALSPILRMKFTALKLTAAAAGDGREASPLFTPYAQNSAGATLARRPERTFHAISKTIIRNQGRLTF